MPALLLIDPDEFDPLSLADEPDFDAEEGGLDDLEIEVEPT
ncbi:hypothetical protein V1281_004230 [Nitrobacteraceae bacterium AZCC 2161]